MRRSTSSCLVGFSMALLLCGLTPWLAPQPASPQMLPGDPVQGKLLYSLHCERCHGTGGWGDGPDAGVLRVPPTNFHGPITRRKTDEQLLTSIEFGLVLSPMHAFRGTLTDRELSDVLAYVRLLVQRGK